MLNDDAGSLVARAQYDYDDAGRLKTLINWNADSAIVSSFAYVRDKVGNPTRITYQDGRWREYAYDDLYQLTGEVHKRPDTPLTGSEADPQVLLQHAFTYDDAGNRDTMMFDDDENKTVTYSVNTMNQIASASGTRGNRTDVTAAFDEANAERVEIVASHNSGGESRDAVSGWLRGDFAIGRGVELWDDTDNAVELTVYDRAGNSESDTETNIDLDDDVSASYDYENGCIAGDGRYTYEYDRENRLVCVKEGGNPVVAFAYDALGRRVLKDDGTTVTRFIYDGQNVIEEYEYDDGEDEWDLVGQYLHGIGIDNVLSIERGFGGSVERWYYLHDGLGSVTELLDDDGALAQAYEYDAWGTPTIYDPDETAIRNPYLYTGREWDAECGLYYYRARHYAPQLGRFLQPDASGYADGPNLYAYVRSMPVRYTDPDGREAATTDERNVESNLPPASKCPLDMWEYKRWGCCTQFTAYYLRFHAGDLGACLVAFGGAWVEQEQQGEASWEDRIRSTTAVITINKDGVSGSTPGGLDTIRTAGTAAGASNVAKGTGKVVPPPQGALGKVAGPAAVGTIIAIPGYQMVGGVHTLIALSKCLREACTEGYAPRCNRITTEWPCKGVVWSDYLHCDCPHGEYFLPIFYSDGTIIEYKSTYTQSEAFQSKYS